MKNTFGKILLAFGFLTLLPSVSFCGEVSDEERIVTMGGAVTETVFALGAGNKVIACDRSSLYPPQVRQLPQVGVVMSISPEGVLAMNPTLILTSSRIGPEAAAKQLRESGVPYVQIPVLTNADHLYKGIGDIGKAINKKAEAEKLIATIRGQLAEAKKLGENRKPPKVIFLVGHGAQPMATGSDTQANAIITLAGGKNCFSDFSGSKPISEEAVLEMQPDFILLSVMSGEGRDETDSRKALTQMGFKNLDALSHTRVVTLDTSYFLSMGPRTGEAAVALAKIFFSENKE